MIARFPAATIFALTFISIFPVDIYGAYTCHASSGIAGERPVDFGFAETGRPSAHAFDPEAPPLAGDGHVPLPYDMQSFFSNVWMSRRLTHSTGDDGKLLQEP